MSPAELLNELLQGDDSEPRAEAESADRSACAMRIAGVVAAAAFRLLRAGRGACVAWSCLARVTGVRSAGSPCRR